MNIGIVVLCRYSSSRLPGKIMLPLAGRTILGNIVTRLERTGMPLVVATSDAKSDDQVAAHCGELGVKCYRGSLDNVAGRFLNVAQENRWEYAVRINGDNLFVSPELIIEMAKIAATGEHGFVTNVPGRTFPPGTSVEIVNVEEYAHIYASFSMAAHFEHVTAYLYEHPKVIKRHVVENPDKEAMLGIDLAVDTKEDFLLAEKLAERLSAPLVDRSINEIVCEVKKIMNVKAPSDNKLNNYS